MPAHARGEGVQRGSDFVGSADIWGHSGVKAEEKIDFAKMLTFN